MNTFSKSLLAAIAMTVGASAAPALADDIYIGPAQSGMTVERVDYDPYWRAQHRHWRAERRDWREHRRWERWHRRHFEDDYYYRDRPHYMRDRDYWRRHHQRSGFSIQLDLR